MYLSCQCTYYTLQMLNLTPGTNPSTSWYSILNILCISVNHVFKCYAIIWIAPKDLVCDVQWTQILIRMHPNITNILHHTILPTEKHKINVDPIHSTFQTYRKGCLSNDPHQSVSLTAEAAKISVISRLKRKCSFF